LTGPEQALRLASRTVHVVGLDAAQILLDDAHGRDALALMARWMSAMVPRGR
jgi:hypothetical protein